MLIRPQIGFTYDCENCKQPVSGSVELFTLSNEHFVHKCSCGHGVISITSDRGKRFFVDYPCAICGRRHHEDFSAADALTEPVVMTCTETGFPVFFAGSPDRIEYMDSAFADDDIAELIRDLLTSPECGVKFIRQAAVDLMEQLRFEGKIRCECGCNDFKIKSHGNFITVSCAVCENHDTIKISCWEDIAELSRRGGVYLRLRQ